MSTAGGLRRKREQPFSLFLFVNARGTTRERMGDEGVFEAATCHETARGQACIAASADSRSAKESRRWSQERLKSESTSIPVSARLRRQLAIHHYVLSFMNEAAVFLGLILITCVKP